MQPVQSGLAPTAETSSRIPPGRVRGGIGGSLLVASAVLLYAVVLLRTAWLCDDAYITFRTVENFLGGYGLTWNVAERVQVYTHPLWMFLLAGLRLAGGEMYYTSLFASMALSLAAALVVVRAVARTSSQALLAMAVLVSSKAFVDFSTSGLENPLSYLLVSLFLAVYLHDRLTVPRRLLVLSLLASLLATNRMDLLLLLMPGLGHVTWQATRAGGVTGRSPRFARVFGLLVAGFLPLIAWEVFSLVYYGFVFPNTAYAKLNTGIPAWELARQGACYLANSLRFDPVTLPAMAAALVVAVRSRRTTHLALAGGLLLYTLYVVKIGGDYMSGRFLAVPLLAAAGILAAVPWPDPTRVRFVTTAALTAVLLGFCGPWPSLLSGSRYDFDPVASIDAHQISDERGNYFQATGLWRASPRGELPDKPAARLGRRVAGDGTRLLTETTIMGMTGYYAGPAVHIVDQFALPDPLLARLPMRRGHYRIGHFPRFVPDGYIHGLRSGRNELTDLRLREFYDKLRLVTRGPIFSKARWRAIADLNLGRCRHLVDTQYYRHPPPRLQTGPHPAEPDRWTAAVNYLLPSVGLWIDFGRTCHARQLEVGVEAGRDFRIFYPRGSDPPVEQRIAADPAGPAARLVRIPEDVSRHGFDRLLLLPVQGDAMCYIHQVRVLDPQSPADHGR